MTVVVIKNDIGQSDRIVTAITERQFGYLYELAGYDTQRGPMVSWHYDFEIKPTEEPLPIKTKRSKAR